MMLKLVIFSFLILSLVEFSASKVANKRGDALTANRNRVKPISDYAEGRSTLKRGVGMKLLGLFYKVQVKFFTEAKELAVIADSNSEVGECNQCSKYNGDINFCYSSCVCRQQNQFVNLASSISETVKNIFCKPLGFKFARFFTKKLKKVNKIFVSFKAFLDEISANTTGFSLPQTTEFWCSNLIYLDGSPMLFYNVVRDKVISAIDKKLITGGSSATSFAAKCETLLLKEGITALVTAAASKTYIIDIVLRGFFTLKSAALYAVGTFQNIFKVFLEGISTIIGRKCNIIAYAMGLSTTPCDNLGIYPYPNFPVPPGMTDVVSDDPNCVSGDDVPASSPKPPPNARSD